MLVGADLRLNDEMKKCLKCGLEKPESGFYRDKRGYFVSPCKTCKQANIKAYRAANKEKVNKQGKVYARRFYWKNHEKYKRYFRGYFAEQRIKAQIKRLDLKDPPKRLSDCKGHPEPCHWIRCKHHLLWDIYPDIKKKDNREIVKCLFKMPITCIFDYTNSDHTLEDVAQVFGITRERVRQIQDKALDRIRQVPGRRDELYDYIDHENRHPIDPSIYANFRFKLDK